MPYLANNIEAVKSSHNSNSMKEFEFGREGSIESHIIEESILNTSNDVVLFIL